MGNVESDKKSEKESLEKIPREISDYIKNKKFDEEFLTDIRKVTDSKGEVIYMVEISHNETLYKLKFDSSGRLIKKDSEPLFKYEDDEYGIAD